MFQAKVDKVLHVVEALRRADVPVAALFDLGEEPRLDERAARNHNAWPRHETQPKRQREIENESDRR